MLVLRGMSGAKNHPTAVDSEPVADVQRSGYNLESVWRCIKANFFVATKEVTVDLKTHRTVTTHHNTRDVVLA